MTCIDWLQSQLADGPCRRDIIIKRATAAGHGEHRLNLARRALSVVQMASPAGPMWSLP